MNWTGSVDDSRRTWRRHDLEEHRMAMPPTLGDSLNERMGGNRHSIDAAAAATGASPSELRDWKADLGTPREAQLAGIADYLGVDVAEVKRLVLRSQMRRVQREIRGGTAKRPVAS